MRYMLKTVESVLCCGEMSMFLFATTNELKNEIYPLGSEFDSKTPSYTVFGLSVGHRAQMIFLVA